MTRKIIIGIGIAVVLAIIATVIVALSGGGSNTSSNTNSGAAVPGANGLVKIYQMPTSTTITLGSPKGSVTMKNFYLSSAGAEDQFIVLVNASTYQTTYDTNANEFYIYVPTAPYDANRTIAENDFLARLGITKADACKLTVGEGLGTQRTQLSFCSPSGVIQ